MTGERSSGTSLGGLHASPGPVPVVSVTEDTGPRQAPGPGPFHLGQVVGGHYEIIGVLGQGGMGVVYDAVDHALRRSVAIKAPRFAHDVAALHAEAEALAALRSPFFVSIYAVGSEEGTDFVVMERLHGETLEDRIAYMSARSEHLPVAEVVDLLVPLAGALAAAHAAGLTQRDLKPANVILSGERVVLFDFGVAVPEALVERGAHAAGTLQYMAPEVLLGGVTRGSGPMVDLYALGVVGYELLTNTKPFRTGSAGASLFEHVSAPVPDVRSVRADVPDDLAELLLDLMATDPGARPPGAEAVVWQLEQMRHRGARRAMRRLRVLAVDDDPLVGTALKRSLESAFPRIEVTATTNPEDALRDSGDQPDVVLVDLNMPGYNGVEVCMHLASRPPSRRPVVVAMSAQAEERDIEVLRALGVREFVPKNDSFVSSVGRILARVRANSTPLSRPPGSRS